MISTVFALFAVVFVIPGVYILYRGVSGLRTVYYILTNDPISVRECASRTGPVEIEGTATDDDGQTVTAPFTDTDCLAYEYEAQEYRSSGKSSSWKTVDEGDTAVSFLVDDETGTVRVDPTGADLQFESHTLKVDGGDEPPKRIAQYISATDDIDSQNKTANLIIAEFDYGRDQRFIERRLDISEDVYVYGEVNRVPSGEWRRGLVDGIISDGDQTPVFVISDTSERETAWRISKQALALTGLGLLWVMITVLFGSVVFL